MRSRLLVSALALAAVAVGQKAPVHPPAAKPATILVTPNPWFAKVYERVEAEFDRREIVARFPFKNPNAGDIEWREFEASCACSHLEFVVGDRRYWLKPKPRELVRLVPQGEGKEPLREPVTTVPVHGGEQGEIEVHIALADKTSRKSVLIDIHSSDTATPQMKLQVDASHELSLVVTPPEIDLGNVAPGESREWTVEVTARRHKDFEVTPPADLPAGITAQCTKVVNNGIAVWSIHGTYGPFATGKGGPVMLKFGTTIPGESSFDLRVAGTVVEAVTVTPGFLTIGRIDPKVGARGAVRFHATDGSDLAVEKATLVNVSPEAARLETAVRKDGKDVVVEVVVPSGVPTGLVRGELQVELDHATSKSFKVLFNGFAR